MPKGWWSREVINRVEGGTLATVQPAIIKGTADAISGILTNQILP